MNEPKTYNLDDIPTDTTPNTGSNIEYEPLDPMRFYQVEVLKAEFRDNPFYKPDAKKPEDKGSKYNVNFEFAVVEDGEYYGRRLWKKTSPSLMPTTRKGEPTVLYKIVSSAMNAQMDWDACSAFAPDNKTLMVNIEEVVVGKQIIVGIENITDPDTKKVATKVKSYNPVKKALPKFDAEKSKAIGEAKKAGIEPSEFVVATSEPAKQDDPLPGGLDFDNAMKAIEEDKKKK